MLAWFFLDGLEDLNLSQRVNRGRIIIPEHETV